MIALMKPNNDTICRVLAEQARVSFNYSHVGLTRDSDTPPVGFAVNQCRTVIGHGEAAFERAKVGIRKMEMLNLGWISVVPFGSEVAPGGDVGTLVKLAAGWALQVARVVYTIDDESQSQRRFGFGYGTLPEYPMCGEERFLATFDPVTNDVAFEIYSFSRPSTVLGWLGISYLRKMQRRFRRDSALAMQTFIDTGPNVVAVS